MIPDFVRGAIAPTFTAFNADGSLDDAGQRELLDFLYEPRAISAFFVRSGMGQMYTFEYEDVRQLAKNACTHLAGKAPVLVGCAGIWDHDMQRRPDPKVFTEQAVSLSRYAEEIGASGVVHTLPEAIAPQDGETYGDVILRYFETLNDAIHIPIFIYQPPITTPEYRVTVELVRQLADLPNVLGMKASTADAGYILDILWAVSDKDFAFIAGNETAFYAALCCGSRATIGQGCCLNPQIICAVQERFERKDYRGAIDAQRSVNLLVEKAKSPVEFLKRYAAEKGYRVQPYRRATAQEAYQSGPTHTVEEYEAYKHLLESELEKFATVPAYRN